MSLFYFPLALSEFLGADLDVDGWIILKESSGNGMWVYVLKWVGLGYRQVAKICDCGNEPLGSVKYGEMMWYN